MEKRPFRPALKSPPPSGRRILGIILAGLLVLSPSAAWALDCASPRLITASGSFYGDTWQDGSSQTSAYGNCGLTTMTGPEVVYKVSVTRTYNITATLHPLVSGNFQFRLIWLNTCNPGDCFRQSLTTLTRTVNPGDFYLVVDADNLGGGAYRLDMDLQEARLECSGAAAISCGANHNDGTTSGPYNVLNYGCGGKTLSGPEKVFVWENTGWYNVFVRLTNIEAGKDLDVVLLNACDAGSCLEHGDTEVFYQNAVPGRYYIVVDGANGDAGGFTVNIQCTPLPTPTPTMTPILPTPTNNPNTTPTPEPTPPAPPRNLRATQDPDGVHLNWEASTSGNLRGYNVYRKNQGSGGEEPLIQWHSLTSYDDTGALEGVTYLYSVAAEDMSGIESLRSNGVAVTRDGTPPETPHDLTASKQLGTIHLAWKANTEPDLSGYRVFRQIPGSPAPVEISGLLRGPFFDDPQAFGDVQYSYSVLAEDLVENQSPRSASLPFALDNTPPRLPLAGYWNTRLVAGSAGIFAMIALVTEPERAYPSGPMRVILARDGVPLGLDLTDDGQGGDPVAGDGVFFFQVPIPFPPAAVRTRVDLLALDGQENESGYWPFLTIR